MSRTVEHKDLLLSHPNFVNPRPSSSASLSKEAIETLAADLKTRHIQMPLLVQKIKKPSGEGFDTLILDGQRRFLAADYAGIYDLPVEDHSIDIIDLTPEIGLKLELDMLALGHYREPLSSPELLENAKRLRARGATVNAIGKAIGRDGSWVTRFLDADKNANPDIKKAWQDGRIPDEMFKELAVVKKVEQPDVFAAAMKLREENDPGTARAIVKEAAAIGKAEREEVKGRPGPKPKAAAPKAEADKSAKKDETTTTPRAPRAAVEELAALGKGKKPIMDPYVKGLVHGAMFSLGEMSPADFEKAWHRYIARMPVQGAKPVSKATVAAAKNPAKKGDKKAKKAAKAAKAKK